MVFKRFIKKNVFLVFASIFLLSSIFQTCTMTVESASFKTGLSDIEFVFQKNFNKKIYKTDKTMTGWPQIFDCGSDDSPNGGLAIDSKGDVIVSAYTNNLSSLSSNLLTIKYDSEGNVIWHRFFDTGGFDLAWEVTTDSMDNIIVLGIYAKDFADFQNLEFNFSIIKYNSIGNILWTKYFHKSLNSYPGGVAVDSNDNIIMTGGIGDFDQVDFSCWTIKLDEAGNEIWNITFREDMINVGSDVTINSEDEIFVTGLYASFFGQGFYTTKFDMNGDKIWTKRYSGGEPDSIILDSQGNIILTGRNYASQSGTVSWYTIKSDIYGDELWTREYDSGEHDSSVCVTVDQNDNIIAIGYSNFSLLNNYEHCLIIYDKDGQEICIKRPGTHGFLYGVGVDTNGKIIVTGSIKQHHNNWDIYTTKFEDVSPPDIELLKPEEKNLYIANRRIMSLTKNTIVIGKLSIETDAENLEDVSKIEFYIDNELIEIADEAPFEWIWDETSFQKHNLRIMVYDVEGNAVRKQLDLWKFL
jgi:hypothetical protein